MKLFEKEAHISLISYNVQHGFWRTKEKETWKRLYMKYSMNFPKNMKDE